MSRGFCDGTHKRLNTEWAGEGRADEGLLGFDTNGIVTAAMAANFFARGFRFCVRYVSRMAKPGPDDLSTSEAIDLLSAGLALMPRTTVCANGWLPSPELGALDGVHAAYHAFVIGFPTGVNVWCDLEGVSVDAIGASRHDAVGKPPHCATLAGRVAARHARRAWQTRALPRELRRGDAVSPSRERRRTRCS
jgi:hypothetical protein